MQISHTRTFATVAVAAGVDVKTLSSMLGHASAKVTLDVYAAAGADARAAAAARLERAWRGRAALKEGRA